MIANAVIAELAGLPSVPALPSVQSSLLENSFPLSSMTRRRIVLPHLSRQVLGRHPTRDPWVLLQAPVLLFYPCPIAFML